MRQINKLKFSDVQIMPELEMKKIVGGYGSGSGYGGSGDYCTVTCGDNTQHNISPRCPKSASEYTGCDSNGGLRQCAGISSVCDPNG
jgi:natural product precursor